MNLTEVVLRANDTLDDILRKVRIASILGTVQSTLTNFHFLSDEWETNCEEERLLGVSLTGIMDHPILSGQVKGDVDLEVYLQEMRDEARRVNKEYSERFGINESAAITCVKPSGTVSELVGSSSGIHPRYSKFYSRSIRQDVKDPLTQFLKDAGIPWEQEKLRPESTVVFSFPVESPANAVLRDERSAVEQLEHWLLFQRHWCEHKPSVTIYVKSGEWLAVAEWVFRHFDEVSGISFLPHSDHSYEQAPFQEVSEHAYKQLVEKMPTTLDWNQMREEEDDYTTGAQEYACVGGQCTI